MNQRIICIVLCLLTIGCTSLNKGQMCRFEPFSENGKEMFRFSSERNDSVYPDDAAGEAVRISWLAEYMADNNYCNNGYVITSRQVVKGGDIYGLRRSYYYAGECK